MNPRPLTIGTVTGLAAATVALLGYALFGAYRNLVTTGDAHLQQWVAPQTARWLYLGIAAAVLAGIVAASAVATAGTDRPWLVGVLAGLGAGGALAVLALLLDAVATSSALLTAGVLLEYLAILAGAPLVGVLAARRTGRVGSGVNAAVWFAVLLALTAGLAESGGNLLFAHRLVTGAWLGDTFGDPTCTNVTGHTLAACEIGDTLGGVGISWLLFPLLGAGLGALGGLGGAAMHRAEQGERTQPPRTELLAPLCLCGYLLIVLVLEAGLNLW